ncbi:MAG TPA: acetyltransferase [Salinisphaeraceae bacterium]|nr:acetyltransferase [Salinisphaeraceae bacterium]
MTRLLQTLRGILALAIMALATLIGFIPLLPLALLKLLAPWPAVKRPTTHALIWLARIWIRVANLGLIGVGGCRPQYEQQIADQPNGRFILISNHQSWADVMLLVHVILPQFPFPRFFIKEQLRWLPIVGLACWALDFPFMKRLSREEIRKNPALRNSDLDTMRRACRVFRDWPVTIINYAEGTRSTAAKRAAQQSTYQTMLPPKAGGTAFTIKAMGDLLDGVLDMTVAYVNTPTPTFWDFICGRIPAAAIRLRQLELPADLRDPEAISDAEYRRRCKAWLNMIWAEKDAEVAAIQDPENPQTAFDQAPAEALRSCSS